MIKNFIGLVSLVALAFVACVIARAYAGPTPKTESIVLAVGSFRGVQTVFQHTKSATTATSD